MSLPRYPRYVNAGLGWLSDIPAHWSVLPNKAVLRPRNETVGSNASDFLLLSLTLSGVVPRDIGQGI
jgi:type I restriction enzyme, S subunit